MRYTPLDEAGIERCKAEVIADGEVPDPNNVYFKSEIVGGVHARSEYIKPTRVDKGIREVAARRGPSGRLPGASTWR